MTRAKGEPVPAGSPDSYAEAIRLGELLGWACLPLYERDGRWVPPYTYTELLGERYSLELIEKLWDGHEDAPGVGAIWPRDVVAAEADSEAGEAWLATKRLPRTPTFASRRGPHYLFRGNGAGVNPSPAEGVEVLSRDGGKRLMSLPPTAGKRWWPSLDPTDVPFATLPAALSQSKPAERERVEILAQPIPEGRRTNEMARIVGKLCAVLPADAALAAAVSYDRTYCRPPLGESRVRRMVEDWAERPAGGWVPVDLSPVLTGAITESPPSILERSDGQPAIYRGKVHRLAGEPESGKDWLMLRGCAGRMALGEPCLYIDFEDSAVTAVSRLRDLGVPDGLIAELFVYVRPEEPLVGDVRAIAPDGLALTVLSGVTEALYLHGLKQNDAGDEARFQALLARPLADAGAAVVLIDHVVKDRDGRGRWAIGSQHKMAGIDVGFSLESIRPFGRGMEGASRLTVTKDRPGFLRPASEGGKTFADVRFSSSQDGSVTVRLEPPAAAQSKADPLGLSPATRRVLDALEDETHPLRVAEIGDRVVVQGWAAGLHRRTIERSLEELAERELADSSDDRYGTRWWRT